MFQDIRFAIRMLGHKPGVTVLATAALAAYLPARGAARIAPSVALRSE